MLVDGSSDPLWMAVGKQVPSELGYSQLCF
jgi:hypothetical protein